MSECLNLVGRSSGLGAEREPGTSDMELTIAPMYVELALLEDSCIGATVELIESLIGILLAAAITVVVVAVTVDDAALLTPLRLWSQVMRSGFVEKLSLL